LLLVAYEAQENKTEIKELRQELKDLTAVVQRLAHEFIESMRTKRMNDFTPIKSSRIGELAAKFDIVLGFTAEA
jgi:hypothetical protein